MKQPLLSYLCLLTLLACSSPEQQVIRGEVVNVYSDFLRMNERAIFDDFEQQSGLKVNLVHARPGRVLSRIQEAPDSLTADLILLQGAGQLHRAAEEGLLDSIRSLNLLQAVPPQLQDSSRRWASLNYDAYGLSYPADSLDSLQIATYAEMAEAPWREKIRLTSPPQRYQSLLAAMMADRGRSATREWLDALTPADSLASRADSVQWLQLTSTQNHLQENQGSKWSFPREQVYLHIRGVGLHRRAPHPERARRLLAYLLSREVMQQMAEQWQAYPASAEVSPPATLQRLGRMQPDTTSQNKTGGYSEDAARVLREQMSAIR
jgi:iron(III) transport system substrate-binding protein